MAARPLIGFMALVGCPAEQVPGVSPGVQAVALVADGVSVGVEDLAALRARVPFEQSAWLEEDRRTTEFMDHVVLTQALYGRAVASGLHHDPEVARVLAMSARETLAAEYLRAEADRAAGPAQVDRRWRETAAFHGRQLRVSARAGGPEEVVQDLGWLDAQVVVDTFGETVAASAAGVAHEGVWVGSRAHHIEVTGVRDEIPVAEVAEQIAAELRSERSERILEEVQATLRVVRP